MTFLSDVFTRYSYSRIADPSFRPWLAAPRYTDYGPVELEEEMMTLLELRLAPSLLCSSLTQRVTVRDQPLPDSRSVTHPLSSLSESGLGPICALSCSAVAISSSTNDWIESWRLSLSSSKSGLGTPGIARSCWPLSGSTRILSDWMPAIARNESNKPKIVFITSVITTHPKAPTTGRPVRRRRANQISRQLSSNSGT